MCQSLFFNKVAGQTLLNKGLWHMLFPVNLTKFLRTSFLTEHLCWLLLKLTPEPLFLLKQSQAK